VETGYLSSIALGYRLRVRDAAGAGNFSHHHRFQTGSGAHPASHPVGTRGSFLGSKAAGPWSWPLTSIYCRGHECVEMYLHSPNMPSWLGAQLRHRDKFTFAAPLLLFTRKNAEESSLQILFTPCAKLSVLVRAVTVWSSLALAANTEHSNRKTHFLTRFVSHRWLKKWHAMSLTIWRTKLLISVETICRLAVLYYTHT